MKHFAITQVLSNKEITRIVVRESGDEKKTGRSYYRQKCEGEFETMREGDWEGRVGGACMTACDATLVTVQEDRGACAASLALSPLTVACVCL